MSIVREEPTRIYKHLGDKDITHYAESILSHETDVLKICLKGLVGREKYLIFFFFKVN